MGENLPQLKSVTKLLPVSKIQLLVFQFPLMLSVQYLTVFPKFIKTDKYFLAKLYWQILLETHSYRFCCYRSCWFSPIKR